MTSLEAIGDVPSNGASVGSRPIDIDSIREPVKAMTCDGGFRYVGVYDTWAGAWAFPSSWTDEEMRKTWIAIQGELIFKTNRLKEAVDGIDADAASPARQLAEARFKVDEATRAAEQAERRREGEEKWIVARERFGASCKRINTVEGDVVIMTAMTQAEADAANSRGQKLLETFKDDKTRGMTEYTGAHRDAMIAKIAWPKQDRVRELAARYVDMWSELVAMRDSLARARADEEGKDSAP